MRFPQNPLIRQKVTNPMVEDEPYPKDILMANPDAMYNIILGLDKRVKDLEKKLREIAPLDTSTRKRGGSDKGKSGLTWTWENEVITKHNYVDSCLNCAREAPEKDQIFSYSKRMMEMVKPLQMALYDIHSYNFVCPACKKTTQAAEPTLQGTSLGPRFLAFLATMRFKTGRSFEDMSLTIAEITGVKISQTSLNRAIKKVCEILQDASEIIKTEIMNADNIYLNIPASKSNRKTSSFHGIFTDLRSICISFKHPDKETAISVMSSYSVDGHPDIREESPEDLEHILEDIRLYTVGRSTFKSQSTREIYGVLLTVLTTWNMQGIHIEEKLLEVLENHLKSKIK